MNNYGIPIAEFRNDPDNCVKCLATLLNAGHLGLLLGAGASKGLGLPGWDDLLKIASDKIGLSYDKSEEKKFSNQELKDWAQKIKDSTGNEAYLTLIKNALYEGVRFDLDYAKQDLLVSLMSLVAGRARGSVKNIITYNFDTVLEWYFRTCGLKVNITSPGSLFYQDCDVDVIHLHGFLPHHETYGQPSEEIVMATEEAEDRMVQQSYFKELMDTFFRRQVFLSVGLSADSLKHDVALYLRRINKWYDDDVKIPRKKPYGFAFLSPDNEDADCDKLAEFGIVTCKMEINEIYKNIFRIAEKALSPD